MDGYMRTLDETENYINKIRVQFDEAMMKYNKKYYGKYEDFIDKFCKIRTYSDRTVYIHISSVFVSGNELVICGHAFCYEIPICTEDICQFWKYEHYIYVPLRDVSDFFINNVIEISKCEFKRSFNNMIMRCTEIFNEEIEMSYK